jgi:hypothetical protein
MTKQEEIMAHLSLPEKQAAALMAHKICSFSRGTIVPVCDQFAIERKMEAWIKVESAAFALALSCMMDVDAEGERV